MRVCIITLSMVTYWWRERVMILFKNINKSQSLLCIIFIIPIWMFVYSKYVKGIDIWRRQSIYYTVLCVFVYHICINIHKNVNGSYKITNHSLHTTPANTYDCMSIIQIFIEAYRFGNTTSRAMILIICGSMDYTGITYSREGNHTYSSFY